MSIRLKLIKFSNNIQGNGSDIKNKYFQHFIRSMEYKETLIYKFNQINS